MLLHLSTVSGCFCSSAAKVRSHKRDRKCPLAHKAQCMYRKCLLLLCWGSIVLSQRHAMLNLWMPIIPPAASVFRDKIQENGKAPDWLERGLCFEAPEHDLPSLEKEQSVFTEHNWLHRWKMQHFLRTNKRTERSDFTPSDNIIPDYTALYQMMSQGTQ